MPYLKRYPADQPSRRRFYSINIQEQSVEEVAQKFIDFLGRDNTESGEALEIAKKEYTSRKKQEIVLRKIPEAWTKIITEPDELLADIHHIKI